MANIPAAESSFAALSDAERSDLVNADADQIRKFLHDHDARRVLALLAFDTLFGLKGARDDQSPIRLEYAVWIWATTYDPSADSNDKEETQKIPSDSDYRDFVDTIDRLVVRSVFQRGMKADFGGNPDVETESAFRTGVWMHHLLVRNPAFPWKAREVFDEIFTCASDAIERVVGVPGSCLTRIDKALEEIVEERVNSVIDNARFASASYRHKQDRSKEPGGVQDDDPYVNELSIFRTAQWLQMVDALTVSAEMVSEGTDIDVCHARTFLRMLSMNLPEATMGGSPLNLQRPMEETPIVHLGGDDYFIPLPHKTIWALKKRVDSLLATEKSGKKYTKTRADVVEKLALEYFSRGASEPKTWHSLEYLFDNGEGERRYELDGLVAIGSWLLIIEVKAGTFRQSARQGAPSTARDLRKSVGHAHEQALRAKSFIESAEEVEFEVSRRRVLFSRSAFTRIQIVTVSLEDVTAFANRSASLTDHGVVSPGEKPWVVSLTDLDLVTDIVEWPAMLCHYIHRRTRLFNHPRLRGSDEIVYLGHYIKHGLWHVGEEEGSSDIASVSLGGFGDDIDEYFKSKEGLGTVRRPKPKPKQKMPGVIRVICEMLARCAQPGAIDFSMMLLDGNEKARVQIAKLIQETRVRAKRKKKQITARVEGEAGLLVYSCCPRDQFDAGDFEDYLEEVKHEARARLAAGLIQVSGQPLTFACVFKAKDWEEDPVVARRWRARTSLPGYKDKVVLGKPT